MAKNIKVAIIGSGPAGYTAAIYTGRANLSPVVFEGMQPGGQLTITTEVENFPGFEHGIMGPELMNTMKAQAQRFGTEFIADNIVEADFKQYPFYLKSNGEEYYAETVIVSTGATARLLNVPGVDKYMGFGVSACATCDGFFFRNLKVIVVGGGDSAMEEANFLTKFASEVLLVHRREEFRASKIMEDRAKANPKIKFVLNSTISEVHGTEENGIKKMTGVTLLNVKTNEETIIDADGLFFAIGHKPNTDIFKGQLDMDETGYLLVTPGTSKTNIDGVFAAGDVADKNYRQAITAAGSGCMAALDAERWLEAKH